MINTHSQFQSEAKPIRAVGLLSGGLDSTLAVKLMSNMGIEVHAVYFAMPWGCCHKDKAYETAHALGIDLIVLQLNEQYLEMVKKPKHGYGTALNPCVDCRVHMFKRAGEYMRKIGADFVFTGEVLGQRPMSQKRDAMRIIEKEANLKGRILRPLCAHLMEPTIPEQQGLIDRDQLLNLSGRSRRPQMELAEELGITDYGAPAGGCKLTDHNFAKRMKDTFEHGYRNFRETISLQWGRHFRYSKDFKIIVGRDEPENNALKSYAHPKDTILEVPDKRGPTVVIKGENPSEEVLTTAASLLKQFSKRRTEQNLTVEYWYAGDQSNVQTIEGRTISEKQIEGMYV